MKNFFLFSLFLLFYNNSTAQDNSEKKIIYQAVKQAKTSVFSTRSLPRKAKKIAIIAHIGKAEKHMPSLKFIDKI